jgi:hypothetical protein
MKEIKIKSTRKSKKKLADCGPASPAGRLRTVDLPGSSHIAYCRLKTCLAGRQAAYLPILLMTLILLLSSTAEINPTIRYVSPTGNNVPPYLSWEDAANSIQDAINVCEPCDTVLVANGVYIEKVIVDKFIYLIGLSQDSCVIDGSNELSEEVVKFSSDGLIENFTILARGQNLPTDCVLTYFANVFMRNCKLKNGRNGLFLVQSSSVIEKCIILNCAKGIDTACPTDTCNSAYINNVIFSVNSSDPQILHFIGGSVVMKSNLIFSNGSSQYGTSFESQKRVVFKNNLVSGFQRNNVTVTSHSDTVFLVNNNSMNVQVYNAFQINQGNKTVLKNNIVQNTNIGISGYIDPVRSDYNLFNNVNTLVSSGAYLGDGNLVTNPMFVNDALPVPDGSYDLHLQAYSPAIDAGDPSILDVDGSRGDIGMYGGPDGERYEYLDLPPRTPKDFTYNFDTTYNLLTLNWRMNTEYDFMNYNIYRDTVSGFIPGDENLLAQSDTSKFTDYLGNISSPSVYYRITAVDSQYNESQPGNEIAVTITGVEQDIQILRDYILYQNFPNPFNPSTKIGYEIKERAYVKLMVYDIKGELISVLVNKEQESGYYEVEFNVGNGLPSVPNNLASGIYLYRIEIIGEGRIPVYSDMKKMLMIK